MTRSVVARAAPVLALLVAAWLGACAQRANSLHRCPTGQWWCGGLCVDLQSDAGSCGACFHPCPSSATCQAGSCLCPGGLIECDGQCVDPATSKEHCGGCNQACGLGACAGGACTCDTAATQCAGFPACVDTATDPAHCGSCDVACTRPGDSCAAGSCACLAPRTDCGTSCADLRADARNCGTCGHDCPYTNDVCQGGACACPSDLPDVCGATCVSLQTSEANCGSCGHACVPSQTCKSGVCACPEDKPSVCSGACCETSACCADGCQTKHDNGLGGSFFDCANRGVHTLDQAAKAADSWGHGGTVWNGVDFLSGCGKGCYCLESGGQAAAWCYDGSGRSGKVYQDDAITSCRAQTCTSGGHSWN